MAHCSARRRRRTGFALDGFEVRHDVLVPGAPAVDREWDILLSRASINALVRHLRASKQLTAGLILRSLFSGNLTMVEESLADLRLGREHVPPPRGVAVQARINTETVGADAATGEKAIA